MTYAVELLVVGRKLVILPTYRYKVHVPCTKPADPTRQDTDLVHSTTPMDGMRQCNAVRRRISRRSKEGLR